MDVLPIIILFIIIIALVVICALYFSSRGITLRSDTSRVSLPDTPEVLGSGRSKLEARVVKILEDITHAPFDQAHPSWLRDGTSAPLELDGYNSELKVALEVQGPGHIKPLPGESYEKYQKRVRRDQLKRELCVKHGIHLITIDYRISLANVGAYLRSRLFDIGILSEKPPGGYIPLLDMVPWRRGD
jgi:hypothetical protein